jgi:hypothetical protein
MLKIVPHPNTQSVAGRLNPFAVGLSPPTLYSSEKPERKKSGSTVRKLLLNKLAMGGVGEVSDVW